MDKQNLVFTEIPHGSGLYAASVALRHEVLRLPLGMAFSAQELEDEKSSFHLGLTDEPSGEVWAVLVLKPTENQILKMRQVAVSSAHQGQGLGQTLVREAEHFAKEKGFAHFVLHARETACRFYKKLGYTREGECFEEVGLPHFRFTKRL